MNLQYTITFHAPWHCGSGLSAGADIDSLVIKDTMGLPYVPGRTIKGLIREALEEIVGFRAQQIDVETLLQSTFFSNATLPIQESKAILANKVASYLYQKVSATAIALDGVAEKYSLRQTEVVVPCTLHAQIQHIDPAYEALFCDALSYIKRLGANRNRGLGRCSCTVTNMEGGLS